LSWMCRIYFVPSWDYMIISNLRGSVRGFYPYVIFI